MAHILNIPVGQMGDMSKKFPTNLAVESLMPGPSNALKGEMQKGGAGGLTTTYEQARRMVPLQQTTSRSNSGRRHGGDSSGMRTVRDEVFARWITEPLPQGCSVNQALSAVVSKNSQMGKKEPLLRIKIRMSDGSEVVFVRRQPSDPNSLEYEKYYSPIDSVEEALAQVSKPPVIKPPTRRVTKMPELRDMKMPTRVELKEVFHQMDFNGNGILSLAEIDHAVKCFWPSFNNRHALIRAFRAADENDSGYISRSEFEFFIRFLINYTKAYKNFSKMDSNGDHRITYKEFFETVKEQDPEKSESEIRDIFSAIDTNGGDMILFEEFCVYIATQVADLELTLSSNDKEVIEAARKGHGLNRQRRRAEEASIVNSQPRGVKATTLVPPGTAKARELFNRADVNGNGMLSLAELDKVIVELWPQFNIKPALMRAYRASDKNNTGFVSRSEFNYFLKYIVTYNNFWAAFKELDCNSDRRISPQEFASSAKALGVSTESEAKMAFFEMDTNNGGYVLFEEFCEWMTRKRMEVDEKGLNVPKAAPTTCSAGNSSGHQYCYNANSSSSTSGPRHGRRAMRV